MTANPPARPGSPSGFALFVMAFIASPLVLVAWAVGTAMLRATGIPRWRLAAVAVAGGALVVWVQGGITDALASHFSGPLSLVHQFGQPQVHLPVPGAFLWPQIALSIPAGLKHGYSVPADQPALLISMDAPPYDPQKTIRPKNSTR